MRNITSLDQLFALFHLTCNDAYRTVYRKRAATSKVNLLLRHKWAI